jgi:Late competence development protein ComFB
MDSILDYLASQSDNVISQTHKNAMELLVAEEIERQLEFLSWDDKDFINKIEVATYALNRLPSLYASSEEGIAWQKRKGQKEYQTQITDTVREALEIVQKDPARFYTPLSSSEKQEMQEAKEALQELSEWLWMQQSELSQNNVSWRELIDFIKQIVSHSVEK